MNACTLSPGPSTGTLPRTVAPKISAPLVAPQTAGDDDVYVPMSAAEKLGKTVLVGGIAAVPVIGAVMTEVVGGQLDLSGTAADLEAVAHLTALANVGSSVLLGVGAVVGGTALTVGAVGLGLCGLVTAGGYYYWTERTGA